MKTRALIIIVILLFGTLSYGQNRFRVEVTGYYFQPTEQAFKDIYGGGTSFGGEVSATVWQWIGVWLGGDYYSSKGECTFTKDAIEIRIFPIHGGIRFQLPNPRIIPYAGFGIGYFNYKETSPFGEVSKGDLGYIGQFGVIFKATGRLFFDIKGSYSYCKAKPEDIEANIGGFRIGAGVGIEF